MSKIIHPSLDAQSESDPIRCEWSALVFRVRGGARETRFDDPGWHDSRDDAWDFAERLVLPRRQ